MTHGIELHIRVETRRVGVRHLAIMFFVVLLISGCANFSSEKGFEWGDGWRIGTVTAVGDGASFESKLAGNCKAPAFSKTSAPRYATIRYRSNSSPTWRTIPMSEDASLAIGDTVYINIRSCAAKLVSRVKSHLGAGPSTLRFSTRRTRDY